MKIGVYGSAAGDIEGIREKAREVGREIARLGHTLITGGCTGLPYEATLGAKEAGGRTIGFSPGLHLDDHVERFGFPVEGFDELIFIPSDSMYRYVDGSCKKLRNVFSVTASDAVVIMCGRCGTLNEFTIAYDLERNIGVLKGTGGITKFIPGLVIGFKKPSNSVIIYEEDPILLVRGLDEL